MMEPTRLPGLSSWNAAVSCIAALLLHAAGCSSPQTSNPYLVTVDLTDQIRALGSTDLDVSEPAAELISAIGVAALPALERAITVESAAIRARAVEVVTSVGAEQSVPLLLRASADAAPAVRAEAILGLGSIDDERGRERVEAALSDPNVEVRRAAADACSTLCRSATAFEKLVELALREETTARMLLPRQSLRVAIQGEGAELVRAAILSQTQPMLAPKATDSQRGRAALLLADAGSVLAPELLTATVRADVDDALRAQAALALGATGDNDAVAALREALDSHKLPTAIACRSLQDMAARGVPGAGLAHADCLPDRPK